MSKTVIIGGVAGGATTAARLRRRNENEEIIIFERGEYISYANCGLPYYVGDVIKSRDALLLQTPEAMKSKFNIDVNVKHEVINILPDDKKVIVKNLNTNEEFEESYDNLVIATGSSPLKPPIPGIDANNIFKVWTVPDTDKIKAFVKEHHPKRAAVIGGGFIGLEMAENLHALGLDVSIIEAANQVMAPIDPEMAALLHENIHMNGVHLYLGDGVKSFNHDASGTSIELSSGKKLEADLIILSIGVRPNSELAKDAGIETNKRGGIVVDASFKTSEKDIYALGDVIEVEHFVSKDKTMIPLAGPANKQARILADILSGDNKSYKGSMGTSVAKVFDLHVAATGLNEKQLKAAGKVKNAEYFTAIINQKSHAGYYPDSTALTLKLIFNQDGKIFGAQVIGQEGVDKRIDSIASVMGMNGTIYDLEELELSYAPPFSSAKDPVNMLGFVAENIINGMVKFTEVDEFDKEKMTLLDVREDPELMAFSIKEAEHIPWSRLRNNLGKLDKNKHYVVFCAIGVRSYNAARILAANGFENVSVLSGGTSFYKSQLCNKDILSGKAGEAGTNSCCEGKKGEEDMNDGTMNLAKEIKQLDCSGLQCPGPIMKVNQTLKEMNDGEILKVAATDMGFAADIDAWCRRTGNTLVKTERIGKQNIVLIKKGIEETTAVPAPVIPQNDGKTMVVFSGDLDKVLASFIIANGAAAMGRPVTMFFTFWGLNVLRKSNSPKVSKTFVEKMFGKMMPKGSTKLKLSKMNMGGIGTSMMKSVMKAKNVDSLEMLIDKAKAAGVKLVACTMSMDIMGIKKEELIDGVEFAGVASYLGDAEESNVNLFI